MSEEGRRVRERRERVTVDTKLLAGETGVSRNTLAAIEAGEIYNRASLAKIERVLERLEDELGHDLRTPDPTEGAQVTFRLCNASGTNVVLEGPVSHLAEFEVTAPRLIKRVQEPAPVNEHAHLGTCRPENAATQ